MNMDGTESVNELTSPLDQEEEIQPGLNGEAMAYEFEDFPQEMFEIEDNDSRSSSDQEEESGYLELIQPGKNSDVDTEELENFSQVVFPSQGLRQLTENGNPVSLCTEPTLVEPRLLVCGTRCSRSAGSGENQNQADKQLGTHRDVEGKILLFLILLFAIFLLNFQCGGLQR